MEWTREQKYRKLEDATIDELTLLEKQVAQCPWRQTFHIQPKTGLLNDPNGLAFYQVETISFINGFHLDQFMGLNIGIILNQRTLLTGKISELELHQINIMKITVHIQEVVLSMMVIFI